MENIYADIAARTGGDIYIGVVGPVRTGKSSLIKRIMEEMVIPAIEDPYRKERAKDELPQSGSGRTIMTSEPKFVPEEAVEITPDGKTQLRIRMIDSVGYMVDGAVGVMEDGVPRMVTTPWFDYEIPITDAAELGTKKVMQEHCTVGLVVTTDGSITDISRRDYEAAERRAIIDMQATGKPFLIILNSRDPSGEKALALAHQLQAEYNSPVFCTDCQNITSVGIRELLRQLLFAFPMQQLHIYLPKWMDAIEPEHPVKKTLYEALLQLGEQIITLASAEPTLTKLLELEEVLDFSVRNIDLGTGTVICALGFPESLFYEILSSRTGMEIQNEAQLMSLLTELAAVKQEYDKLSDALAAVKTTGYGVVMPTAEEMTLDKPELLRKNGAFGVKLKAGAPSIHMIRVDVDTQISPIVGDEKQSQELVDFLAGESPERLWESNIFGKSVYTMIQEGLTSKLLRTPEDVRDKFRGSLNKIVNDGANGLICLII